MATIVQGAPTTGEVSTIAASAFVDQLQVISGFTGAVTFTQTTGGADLTISSSGAVSTTGALAAGSYTATGTTADTGGDTGTFTYTLDVVTLNSLGFPSYSIVGTPDGGHEAAITFNANTPDIFGSYYTLNGDVTGWDSPDMRMTMLTKIGSDVDAEGEIPADLHYRGRSLQFELLVECESEIARENSKLLLAQACNTSACVFTVNEAVPKFLNVVRAGNTNTGKLTMTDQGTTRKEAATQPASGQWGLPVGTYVYPFKATVELYAADPWKYGVNSVVEPFDLGGSAGFTNPGTYPTMNGQIYLTGTGGGTGPINLDTPERGMILAVPTLPAGAPALSDIPSDLTIDLYNKLIYDTGVGPSANVYFLRVLQTPWLRFPAGPSVLTVTPALAGYIQFWPAWA